MKRRPPIPQGRKPHAGIRGDEARFARAVAACQQGDHATALGEAKALLTRPNLAGRAHLLIGVTRYLQGAYGEAETSLREATRRLDNAEAWFNLALALAALHKPDEAEAAYRKTLSLDPSQANAWNNLGNLLVHGNDSHRVEQSVACYREALRLKPHYASAHTNLGFALEQAGDREGAERHYRAALSSDPEFRPALTNLGGLLESGARPEQGLEYHASAWRLAPRDPKLMANVVGLRRRLADWSGDGPHPADLVSLLEQQASGAIPPLGLLAWPEVSPRLLLDTARRFAGKRWAHALQQPPLVVEVTANEGRRIRVGYLSADFRNHPVTHLITDIVGHHDRADFEIFLYAYGPSVEDEARRKLRQISEHFVDVASMSDAAIARKIRDDGIDVLVDLTGYTTHTRLGITARRPAPVIASWLGYIGSLGEPRLADYLIGDAFATPVECAADFSESLALMPGCFQPNQVLATLPPAPSRASEGLPGDAFVFCSFNQCFKLTPQLWDMWCRILAAVDHSVLWLAPMKDAACANLREETRRRGIAPERLIFSERRPLPEHHSRLRLADLALDTMPYNSGTTASDALRAGVPLITVAGRTFVGRMAASLLHSLGMDELVASDTDAYVDLAVALAGDAARLRGVRDGLRLALQDSRLFDPASFARDLEALYRGMLEQRRRGERGVVRVAGAD